MISTIAGMATHNKSPSLLVLLSLPLWWIRLECSSACFSYYCNFCLPASFSLPGSFNLIFCPIPLVNIRWCVTNTDFCLWPDQLYAALIWPSRPTRRWISSKEPPELAQYLWVQRDLPLQLSPLPPGLGGRQEFNQGGAARGMRVWINDGPGHSFAGHSAMCTHWQEINPLTSNLKIGQFAPHHWSVWDKTTGGRENKRRRKKREWVGG